MWRSIFLAMGIFTLILGLEALVIDSATFANHSEGAHDLIPADWAPWSLLSAGTVVILYSFTLPQKLKGSG